MTNKHGRPMMRGPVDGAWNVVRFNWPMYLAGFIAVAIGLGLAWLAPIPDVARLVLLLLSALAIWWIIGSVLMAFWVYDIRQALDCWWAVPHAPAGVSRWVNIHSGLDETSHAIEYLFPDAQGIALDIYDPDLMKEPSIHRARRWCPARFPQVKARYDRLPVDHSSVDVVFIVFAAHELRTDDARVRLLKECHRMLGVGGRLFLAEHPRDAANLGFMGPGVFHFFSMDTWEQNLREAGFTSGRQFSLSPFASVWVCEKTRPTGSAA